VVDLEIAPKKNYDCGAGLADGLNIEMSAKAVARGLAIPMKDSWSHV